MLRRGIRKGYQLLYMVLWALSLSVGFALVYGAGMINGIGLAQRSQSAQWWALVETLPRPSFAWGSAIALIVGLLVLAPGVKTAGMAPPDLPEEKKEDVDEDD